MTPSALLLAAVLAADGGSPSLVSPLPDPPPGGDPALAPDPVHPRAVRVVEAADGFVAYRGADPAPIRGAQLYRAVLRLDLLERHDRKVQLRRVLWFGAGAAVVGGPLLGWVFGQARQQNHDQCAIVDPRPPSCDVTDEQLAENDARVRRGLVAGSAAGAAAGALLAYAAWRVRPHVPDYEEARALAETHNARLRAPPPAREGGVRLRLVPGPAAGLAARLEW